MLDVRVSICYNSVVTNRGVAQPGSALQWGGRPERRDNRSRVNHDTTGNKVGKAPDLPETERSKGP